MKMKEHPILMSTEMVRAILEGRKTQTRRVVKPQPKTEGLQGVYADLYNHEPNHWAFWLPDNRMTEPRIWECPYGQVGDHLWVRETFCKECYLKDGEQDVCYKEDVGDMADCSSHKWRPSIFMPRWASRITLEITNIRVQRLQEINKNRHDEVLKEGYPFGYDIELINESPIITFGRYWDSINDKKDKFGDESPHTWQKNPWVWVIEFRKL